ncbi:solute carrier family 49 member A3 isoform X2 [Boleophthalmus pectinirostris]|uniref:solute carrier family 49 member A3 isoform X2 n=1 Tax=Boleophthalmus pectinirostris TaxID=150288 RepID=UPI00242F7305|nr:solute carrier family 49 member A3 isoform X2 [Boleophthalmus pectinirostris]
MEDGGAESETHAQYTSSLPREEKDKLEKLLVLKVYKRRWFVLLVLCLLNLSNATLWLSFAPVASQTASYLDVSLVQVNWLSLIYMLVFVPLSLGTTWMLDTLGLRITLIVGSWLNMTGAVVRFIGASLPTGQASGRYPVVLVGQTFGALAQPLIIFTPTKLAALWFPEHQRAIANMLASMSNPLGLLLANILSPLLEDYGGVPIILVKNRAYLILMLCLGSGIASFTCFSSLLDQILCVQGYSNDFAGLCGALFIVWGIVGAGLLGVYVDRTKKFIEVTKINLSLSAVACAAFSVVALMPGQSVAVAVVCSLFGFFGFSAYPVAMELSVECSYPVGEATSAGIIFASGQVQSLLYMVLLQSLTTPLAPTPPSVCGQEPQSWRVPLMLLAGLCSFFTCIFVLFFHSRYRRLEAEELAQYGTKEGPVTSDQGPPVEGDQGSPTEYNQKPLTQHDQSPCTIGPDHDQDQDQDQDQDHDHLTVCSDPAVE